MPKPFAIIEAPSVLGLKLTVRLTIGLRKENERWRIAHEHHSYPLSLSETPETP